MLLNDLFEAAPKKAELRSGERRDLAIKLKYTTELIRRLERLRSTLSSLNMTRDTGVIKLDRQIEALRARIGTEQKKLAQTIDKHRSIVPAKVQQLFAKMKVECSDFIKTLHLTGPSYYLYRGIKGFDKPAFVAQSRSDRKAKDSSPAVAKMFDKMLSELGYKALRSNSIFVTSSDSSAGSYGTVYMIFPRNGFNYTYTKHRDLILDNNSMSDVVDKDEMQKFLKEFQDWVATPVGQEQLTLAKAYEGFGTHSSDPNSGSLLLLYNIMMAAATDNATKLIYKLNDAASYTSPSILNYVFKGMPDKFRKVDMSSLISQKSFQQYFDPHSTDLAQAIMDRVEIYISGTYYALRSDVFSDWVYDGLLADSDPHKPWGPTYAKENPPDWEPEDNKFSSYDPDKDDPF